ncbi:Hypothetical protein NTJ_02345 [Nesidiocoris tenuis]|uniref:Uncharacterized protein n=1 Tax=Nesidiocoris tenuis TaxID=355587 RepID=A0ABN7ABX6_9HEMI|nr:Hypothetical protein NTJ_02345 [Nesidiocoris tenuis]
MFVFNNCLSPGARRNDRTSGVAEVAVINEDDISSWYANITSATYRRLDLTSTVAHLSPRAALCRSCRPRPFFTAEWQTRVIFRCRRRSPVPNWRQIQVPTVTLQRLGPRV